MYVAASLQLQCMQRVNELCLISSLTPLVVCMVPAAYNYHMWQSQVENEH